MTFLVVALVVALVPGCLLVRRWWRSKQRHTPLWEQDQRRRRLDAIVEHQQVKL